MHQGRKIGGLHANGELESAQVQEENPCLKLGQFLRAYCLLLSAVDILVLGSSQQVDEAQHVQCLDSRWPGNE